MIVAVDGPAIRAAKAATSTIPIVFVIVADPVQFGLVASLNKPGGNMTGAAMIASETTGDFVSKQLDLLRQMVPRAERVNDIETPGFISLASARV